MISYTPDPILLRSITAESAKHYRIVPLPSENNCRIFLSDTKHSDILEKELSLLWNTPIEIQEIKTEDLNRLLSTHYLTTNTKKSRLDYSEDFLSKIIETAHDLQSSDIHFELLEEIGRVRFRIDGKLIEQFFIEKDEYPAIINKIKIMSNMDIAEKRRPQDGRSTYKSAADSFDLRISTTPTLNGEKLVMRILRNQLKSIDLKLLGMKKSDLTLYQEAIRKPHGLILISGPTGSGKTTTLYATLSKLNTSQVNILTVEDPIEYSLEGINQVQLREDIGLDFPSTMRNFLRQDPDIIMVGEIRDADTAQMAVKASLTGHLVLSTIHTNSAWSTVTRLMDMGIPPYLIANTLHLSVAQRLIRKLCEHCKVPATYAAEDFPSSHRVKENTYFKAQGCDHCHHTGYKGRLAVYEILPISKEIKKLIREESLEIDDYLEENQTTTLKQNALKALREGITSPEEIYPLLSS